MLNATLRCHQGKVRDCNEDSVLESAAHGLWAVADGVGGNGHGDVASQMAVQALERGVRQGLPLRDAIMQADAALQDAMRQQPELKSMATTLVACKVDGEHFEVAWVGDSRAYLLDSEGIHRISHDHNVAGDLVAAGKISESEAEKHPGQHELTQAVGQMSLAEVPRSVGEFHAGDQLLLCTDGVCGVLSEAQMLELIQQHGGLEEQADALLEGALAAGGPDNIGIALLSWSPEEAPFKADDFKGLGRRLPFDRRPYDSHCKQRPWFLVLLLVAIVALIFLV